eukprot:EC097348.1.p2 GENE.EC097348.1~~EC097348.1.p2  ORF type:complete len:127 (+),score=13.12 EC097348.1:280-660(+)
MYISTLKFFNIDFLQYNPAHTLHLVLTQKKQHQNIFDLLILTFLRPEKISKQKQYKKLLLSKKIDILQIVQSQLHYNLVIINLYSKNHVTNLFVETCLQQKIKANILNVVTTLHRQCFQHSTCSGV